MYFTFTVELLQVPMEQQAIYTTTESHLKASLLLRFFFFHSINIFIGISSDNNMISIVI